MNVYQELFGRQRRTFLSGVTRTRKWRMAQLDHMALLLSENEKLLHEAIRSDFKTATQEYLFETYACLGEIFYQQSQLDRWMRPEYVAIPKALAASGNRGMVYRDPHGVALIIGPFNGPLLLLLRPAIAALAAGNCCVLKMSEKTVATSAVMMDLIAQYFDPGDVTTAVGDGEGTAELLQLRFDFIFFTGKTNAGRDVARAAAENFTPLILAMGGQNPVLVDETADLRDAARKIVWGAMAWGGQWCTSPGYVCVHESIAEAFVMEAMTALRELYGSDPKSNSDYSRIISQQEVERLARLIDPDRVVIGGRTDPSERYVDPTIVYPALWSDALIEEEISGPILPVLSYRNFDEALSKIGNMSPPLAAYIFSQREAAIDRFRNELTFGGGAVNQVNIHSLVASMPFGGVGTSGLGHYSGKYGYDAMTRPKSMLVSPPSTSIEHLMPPYTRKKNDQLTMWFDY